jgi:hypothetical protein
MITRDYIMRMINMMMAMLIRLTGLKQEKDYPKAILDIQTTGRMFFGIDWSLITSFSFDEIMKLFGSDFSVAVPKAYVLGVLMKEEADIRGLMAEESRSVDLGIKALNILLETYLQFNEPVERQHTKFIDELLPLLRFQPLPIEVRERIFRYEETQGRFDKAEDELFRILDANPGFAVEGTRFYERLLKLSREQLHNGGLPREEVLDGLSDLKHRHE